MVVATRTMMDPVLAALQAEMADSYLHNGYIDIMNYSLLKQNKISGDKILPYIMDKNDTIDIDTLEDWKKAEKQFVYL